MKKLLSSLALLMFCGLVSMAGAAEHGSPFVTSKELDLTHLLPPPPANDSTQTKNELGEVLILQVTRTPAMEARASADVIENIWRFSDSLPMPLRSKFNQEDLPKFSAFFDRVIASEGAVVDPAKDYWKRPRPHQLSELVHPSVKLSNSGAWPSGHATAGYLMATVLGEMLPELRAEIFQRAAEYAENRIIGGIHFRSDILVGRSAGALIAYKLNQRDDYQKEFAVAKAELRKRLDLPSN